MPGFTFSRERIDQHVEKCGIDVRPAIEIQLERQRIQEFYNVVSERFPDMFESLLQSPKQFQIKKQLPITAQKGNIEVTTFVLTPRGPVFIFSRKIAGLDDEFSWTSDVNGRVVECLEILRGFFPGVNFIRVGKIHELIYGCGDENSAEIVRARFTPNIASEATEVGIAWNEPDEEFNRKFQIAAVEGRSVTMANVGGVPVQQVAPARIFGIKVNLDVNNASVGQHLDSERIKAILDHADEVFRNRLPEVLTEADT